MNTILKIYLYTVLGSFTIFAQQTTFQDSLLEQAAGTWILHGTVNGKETTHDVIAQWVLGHQYLQLHEISHEKKAGGLSAEAIGHGKRSGGTIPFLFTGSDGSLFHTTFAYNREADTWQWLMDGEENGKLQPFARLTLKRK